MKKLLISTFVTTFLAAASCLAQGSITATITTSSGGTGTCTFAATSISEDVSRTVSTNNAPGRPIFDAITLTKIVDKCSVPIYHDFFVGTGITKVVIAFFNSANGAAGTEVLRLTLANCIITSVVDADSAIGPVEKLTLTYTTITIFDPIDGTTATCSATSPTCS